MSAEILLELNNVLCSKKFDLYITSQEREEFLGALLQEARLIEVRHSLRACRDPKDDKFLELAIDGRASCIVSGDDDLLALGEFQGVAILSPADFLRSLGP